MPHDEKAFIRYVFPDWSRTLRPETVVGHAAGETGGAAGVARLAISDGAVVTGPGLTAGVVVLAMVDGTGVDAGAGVVAASVAAGAAVVLAAAESGAAAWSLPPPHAARASRATDATHQHGALILGRIPPNQVSWGP
jgi:hypothetical protein